MASFPGEPGKSIPEGKTVLECNESKDDGVAVASARPHASYLHLAADI